MIVISDISGCALSGSLSLNLSTSVLTHASRILDKMIPALLGVFFITRDANCEGTGMELQILMSIDVLTSVGSSSANAQSKNASSDGTDAVESLKSCAVLIFIAVPLSRAPMMPMQRASSFSWKKCKEWMQVMLCFSPEAMVMNDRGENSCAKMTTSMGSVTKVG